jgi:hypothetical protein
MPRSFLVWSIASTSFSVYFLVNISAFFYFFFYDMRIVSIFVSDVLWPLFFPDRSISVASPHSSASSLPRPLGLLDLSPSIWQSVVFFAHN